MQNLRGKRNYDCKYSVRLEPLSFLRKKHGKDVEKLSFLDVSTTS